MNNDPYSWGNIDRLDQMIKDQAKEFKVEQMKKELIKEEIEDGHKSKHIFLRSRSI